MKDKFRFLTQDLIPVRHYPIRLDPKLSARSPSLSGNDPAMDDRSHLLRLFGRAVYRIIPKIDAVDIAVVEPQTALMRVVDTLTGSRFERVPTRDGRPL